MYLPHTASLPGQEASSLIGRDEDCGFEGNSDLYGLGIRLGIYMQWLSSFAPRGGSQSLLLLVKTYFTFIFAIFVAILLIKVEKTPTYTVEIYVLICIILGGACTMLIALNPKGTKPAEIKGKIFVSWVSALATLCLSDAVACYSFWFWLRGIHNDNFLDTPCGSCVFAIKKSSLSKSKTTKGFAAVSGLIAFGLPGIGAWRVAFLYRNRPSADEPTRPQQDATERDDRGAGGGNMRQKSLDIAILSVKAVYMISFLLAVELTLYWNRVTQVYSVDTPGQLIPLIIGLCGLVQFLYPPLRRRFRDQGILQKMIRGIMLKWAVWRGSRVLGETEEPAP
ncbi:hypothetical protein CEP53_014602 [Fusarium sp. AF-6]|nr:hypothetical protein CEP53_014602 [Fusarium sp. AF-6]